MASEDRSLGPQVGSTAVGVMLMAGNLGGALVVTVMGLLERPGNDFTAAVALASALALGVVVLAATVPEPLRRTEPVSADPAT